MESGKKNIVFDATSMCYPGGVSRATTQLYQALSSQLPHNWTISLYVRSLKKNSPLVPLNPTSIYRFPLPRFAESLMQKSGLIARWTQADLFHATDHFLPLRPSDPCVATIHDTFFLTHFQPEWGAHRYFRKVMPQFAKQCKKIIVESEYVKREVIERLDVPEDRLTVIPWGVDRSLFFPIPKSCGVQDKLLQTFGLVRPYFFTTSCSMQRKNTPLLLEAYSLLLKQNPVHDLVMTWIPPEDIREKYLDKAVRERIHFLGHVSDEQLRLLYNGAYAMIFPSHAEGFGFPVLEAMACGCPVVSSNAGALVEVGGDAVYYFEPTPVESILEALEWCENHPEELKQLGQRGLKRAETFSWQKTAESTLNVYAECLEGSYSKR